MKNIDSLQTGYRPASIYVSTPVAAAPLGRDLARSVPRITDQRLAGPKKNHEQNADNAQHGENRLVQQHLDDAVPEPGRRTLYRGAKRQLAGLVDVVPELPEPGETQGLVGDEPRAVIDHEDKSAGEEQQANQPKETADHASPYICRRPNGRQPIAGAPDKFNLISTLCAISGRIRQLSEGPESVDGAGPALYKTPNGGGRNPAAAVL